MYVLRSYSSIHLLQESTAMMIAQTGKKTKTLPEGLTKAWLFLWPFLAEAQFMLFYSYI